MSNKSSIKTTKTTEPSVAISEDQLLTATLKASHIPARRTTGNSRLDDMIVGFLSSSNPEEVERGLRMYDAETEPTELDRRIEALKSSKQPIVVSEGAPVLHLVTDTEPATGEPQEQNQAKPSKDVDPNLTPFQRDLAELKSELRSVEDWMALEEYAVSMGYLAPTDERATRDELVEDVIRMIRLDLPNGRINWYKRNLSEAGAARLHTFVALCRRNRRHRIFYRMLVELHREMRELTPAEPQPLQSTPSDRQVKTTFVQSIIDGPHYDWYQASLSSRGRELLIIFVKKQRQLRKGELNALVGEIQALEPSFQEWLENQETVKRLVDSIVHLVHIEYDGGVRDYTKYYQRKLREHEDESVHVYSGQLRRAVLRQLPIPVLEQLETLLRGFYEELTQLWEDRTAAKRTGQEKRDAPNPPQQQPTVDPLAWIERQRRFATGKANAQGVPGSSASRGQVVAGAGKGTKEKQRMKKGGKK